MILTLGLASGAFAAKAEITFRHELPGKALSRMLEEVTNHKIKVVCVDGNEEKCQELAGDFRVKVKTEEDKSSVEAGTKFHQELPAGSPKGVMVETTNGNITVAGVDGDTITIDAAITVEGKRQEKCQQILNEVKITVKEEDGKWRIETDFEEHHGYDVTVAFDLKLPRKLTLEAESVNGGIEVKGLESNCELNTINGNVSCENVQGKVTAETINGSIELSDHRGDLEANTINGSISGDWKSAAPANLDLNTINGGIQIATGAVADAEVSAGSVIGNISVAGIPEVTLKGETKSWDYTLGNGAGKWELNTVNGAISISVESAPK